MIASGARYFARRLVDDANEKLGIPDPLGGVWGGVEELGFEANTARPIVAVERRYFRPPRSIPFSALRSKAWKNLAPVPRATFCQLCAAMVATDLREPEHNQLCHQRGFNVMNRREARVGSR